MTETNKPADPRYLTTEVERITAELRDANADVAFLKRLKEADKAASRLAVELALAQSNLQDAIAAEGLALREAEFANFRNITVTVTPGSLNPTSLIAARYTINYERLTYDHTYRINTWKHVTVGSFGALEPDAMRYLVIGNPAAIPASILELAPENPEAALSRFMLALRRGYTTGPATVQ